MVALLGSPHVAAVMDELAPLADRFGAAGHRLFLVGGTVRDLVTTVVRPDAPPQGDFDLDATTTARPKEIKQLLQGWADAIWTQGERFGTIGAMKRVEVAGVADVNGASVERVFEITTHRAEAYRDDSRKPEVAFSDDIVADLSRRDFTVNAMAIEVTSPSPSLVDPFGGVADLAAKVLRTPLTPAESFSDDPLRMLRAARFIARYDLVPVPELLDAVGSMAERLSIVSAERIRDELDKLLAASAPSGGLRFVFATDLGRQALPEVAALADRVVDGSRHADALAHTLAVVAALPVGADDRHLRWAGMFAALGPSVARARMRALRSSLASIDAIGTLVAVHERLSGGPAGGSGRWTAGEVRRLVRDAGPWLDQAVLLARANAAALVDGSAAAAMARVDGAVAQLAALADREDLGSFAPELDGATVMEVLGLSPGRDVGRAVQFLTELRLDAGPVGPTEATRRLIEWWNDHSS
ncbi:MAG: CCA tRNA nucleotidyltransferase [Actinobacteria bacterium]|nr:CCA tRNA nucleotidyltransferase [Actinomycetota bacterium]